MKLTKWNGIMKRSLSALLAMVMLLGNVPMQAFAAEGAEPITEPTETTENVEESEAAEILRQAAKDAIFPLGNISGNIAVLGDSTISGYPQYSALSTYLSVADGYTVTDISKAGDTVAGQLNKWNALSVEAKNSLNYVFVQIGLNDMRNLTPESFRTQYKGLIAQIRADSPDAMLILGTMVPCKARWKYLEPNNWEEVQARWESANEDIKNFYYDCDRVAYLHTDALGLDDNLRTEYDHGDHIHPNASGAKVIAYSWYLAAIGHSHRYNSTVTAPTCTEQGYTTHTCTCGDSYVDSYTAPLGHSYEAVVTAPTCTERGYTTYTCTLCGESYVDDYVDATGHTYENGICTACGEEHPNLVNYEGKVISILGGSNCTFAGYIPVADGFNLEHRSRYPDLSRIPDVTDVSQTWWMQLLTQIDAKLGINDSWAGSQVLNTLDSNSGDLGPDAAMASLTRIQNLGANGTPDVILFFGGCNDIGRSVTLGSFDPATAPTQADLTATKWNSFADAYVAAITRMQHFYPNAKILVMLPYNSPTYFIASKVEEYGEVIRAICDHYGVAYVDLRDSGINSSHLPDNIHPNAEGSDYITTAVLDALLSSVELKAGEHVVHSVTHELTGAKSSLGYYKGISDGKSFITTITGDDVTVTVTMGGVDITDQVYADGKVMISAVTGDVVITAKGAYNADGRLQQLPEKYCCDTNLWTALDPVNEYYTASGWGNNSNSNYSVTFPVAPGDQIWATSFGAAGTNGYSANAVRITWFGEDGVLESLSRDAVYAEFAEYGYVTVPEGAVAVNIPMASNADSWEIYILNRDHTYENGICTVCGEADPDYHIPGDINGDGEVDNKDLTRLFRYLSSYDVEVVEAALDVNGDGAVDNKDLTRLFRYLSHYEVEIH